MTSYLSKIKLSDVTSIAKHIKNKDVGGVLSVAKNLVGGSDEGTTRKCKLCGSIGVNSLSCPLNPSATHVKPRKHYQAKKLQTKAYEY